MFPLWLLCDVLQVSRKGFYSWLKRGESASDYSELDEAIQEIHITNDRNFGTRRQRDALQKMGHRVSRRTIKKRMEALSLKVKYPKAFRKTTEADPNAKFAPNYLDRQFEQDRPNEVWVGDISYIRTSSGFLYLAVVIDLYSRAVVGWSLQPSMKAELVTDALGMALGRRRVEPGLIFHSDRGCQYTSKEFVTACSRAGVIQSMSKKGDCWDNAVAESFFATIKRERMNEGKSWKPARTRLEIFTYIETYYNRRRSHSTLGYLSPAEYEMATLQSARFKKAA